MKKVSSRSIASISIDEEAEAAMSKAGESPAQTAVRCGNIETFKFYMKNGLDINFVDQNGENLLILAIKNNRIELASYLVEVGINLKAKCKKNGETALHLAVKSANEKFVESLILAGADMNAQDSRGNTSLHVACTLGSSTMACMLIHLGADLLISNMHLESALHEACRREMFPVVELICARSCNFNEPNKVGNTPLHVAAKTGNMDVIRLLLLSGSDIDVFNKDGMRAEDLAMVQGHVEASELLSKLGNSIATDKLAPLVEQLNGKKHPIKSIKIKVFGSQGSGKTTLIDSLKCGFFWKMFKKLYSAPTTEDSKSDKKGSKSPSRIEEPGENYTRGINVHKEDISEVGRVSMWDFSGFEPYLAYYDFFIGDPSCIHVVTFDATKEDEGVVKEQLVFWLDFIRTRIAFHQPIGHGGAQLWPPHVVIVATHADRAKCPSEADGRFVTHRWDSLLDEMRAAFERDLILLPELHLLDARLADGAGMKALKSTLKMLKEFLADVAGNNHFH